MCEDVRKILRGYNTVSIREETVKGQKLLFHKHCEMSCPYLCMEICWSCHLHPDCVSYVLYFQRYIKNCPSRIMITEFSSLFLIPI